MRVRARTSCRRAWPSFPASASSARRSRFPRSCRWLHIGDRAQTPGESQAELDRFFTLSLDLFCVAGLEDGYFKRVNPSFERTLGYTSEELLARPFVDFVHPDDLASALAEVAGLARGDTVASFENRFLRKDGSYVWLSWTATPSLETGLLYAAGHDITARKRVEAESDAHQAELERMIEFNGALLDASVDGIRLVDLEGRTLLANSVIEQVRTEIFELPAYTTLQEGAALLAPRLSDPAAYRATMQAMLADPECATQDDFEVTAVRRAFQRHTGPVRDSAGTLIGRIIVMREITAERDAARLKSELVATVSHELRTPLTGVLGFAELLLRKDLDDETRRRYVETIQGEAQRLTALIDDFLDLQRIEAGGFTLALEAFDLSELVQQQVELFSAQSAGHALEFVAPAESLALVGGRDRIGQVIANLLSNAIKYSPAGGAVTVGATQSEGFTRISVHDCGAGIPVAQQAHVFTKFFRVDSSDTRKIGGTGLGLALCHEIVSAHGGRIGFESSEGEGSTFWFELPSAWQAAVVDRVPRTSGGQGDSVLVAEDDATVRRLVVETLAREGRVFREAADGIEALAMIASDPPDVLVLDLAMPGLDGFGVLERLLESTQTRGIPVIVLTGIDLSPSQQHLLEERSTGLLQKREYSGDVLRRLVHEALEPSERAAA